MKRIRIMLWLVMVPAIATLSLAASAAAQTVVVGTGNPDVDVPAVQAAVDQGGDVVLQGHFSFDRPPMVPTAFNDRAMVLVSKAVAISGARDERDDDHAMTTIEGGTIPFYVEAPGNAVTIRGLRFVRPTSQAVLVYAVSGLVIASCKIEGVEPFAGYGSGIEIDTSGTPQGPGHPEKISGTLLIVNNDIDMVGGTASDAKVGVVLWFVGVPNAEVNAYVSENRIRNFTERAVNGRRVGGRTFVERNVIATGTVAHASIAIGNLHPIFLGSDGTGVNLYLIAHNSVDVEWPTGSAAGISVRLSGAIVVDNDINMKAPEGTVFDSRSAGIELTNNSHDNVVQGNRIRGHARAALSVDHLGGGAQANNVLILNRFDGFEPTLADIFVDDGIMNTLIVGQGTVDDHGIGTVIVPVAGRREDKDHR